LKIFKPDNPVGGTPYVHGAFITWDFLKQLDQALMGYAIVAIIKPYMTSIELVYASISH
jgi:hypothetical protein